MLQFYEKLRRSRNCGPARRKVVERRVFPKFATLGVLSLFLPSCDLFAPLTDESYRFRMTVEVETPDGLRAGSSVYEVTAGNRTALLPDMADRNKSLRGEAVAVDLPNDRMLFALLKTDNAFRSDLAHISMAALDPAYNNDWIESADRISSMEGTLSSAEVPLEDYPIFITFQNSQNPSSVRRVNARDMTEVFGEDFRLKRIVVQVTEDPVTTGIETKLPWLPRVYDYLSGDVFGSEVIPNTEVIGLFSTELAS